MAGLAAANVDVGCIKSMIKDGTNVEEPRVQVLSITSKSDGSYTLDISDSDHSCFAVLTSELASQFKENKLPVKQNSVIKLLKFNIKTLKNRNVCEIEEMQTMCHANGVIGKPINIDNENGNSSNNNEKHNNKSNDNSNDNNGASSSSSAQPQAPNQTFQQAMNKNNNNNNSNNNNNNRSVAGSQQTVNSNYQPISTLNPYQNGWRIKVRVTQKGTMRQYTRDGKDGQVFSMNLLDSEGTEIQATMFNEACKKFYPKIEEGSIYYIGNGRVTIARQRYTHIRNDYAITLNENSEVTPVPASHNSNNNNNNNNSNSNNNNDTIMKQVYHFTNIEKIGETCEAGSFADICAIVYDVKEMSQVISKNTGKELKRRNITLCDDTCKLIDVTVWGNLAEEYDKNKLVNNPIIVMKAARVGEYAGGKQLSCNNGILINPFDSVAKSKQLQNWWENEDGKTSQFEALAVSGNAGAGSKIPRYDTAEVKEYRIGYSDDMVTNLQSNDGNGGGGSSQYSQYSSQFSQNAPLITPTKGTVMSMNPSGGAAGNRPAYFTMIGTITRAFQLPEENGDNSNSNSNDDSGRTTRLPWYKACPDAKMNNAKVEDYGNGKYFCAKNGKEYDTYIPRFVTRFAVQDHAGQIWLSAFNEQATVILGCDCKTVENYYKNGNNKKVNEIFKNSNFKKFLFRVRAKSQEYNGEERVRYDLVSVQAINFTQETETLTQKIESLKAIINDDDDI